MISADLAPPDGTCSPGSPVPIPRAVQDPDNASPCDVGSAVAVDVTGKEAMNELQANAAGMGIPCGSAQSMSHEKDRLRRRNKPAPAGQPDLGPDFVRHEADMSAIAQTLADGRLKLKAVIDIPGSFSAPEPIAINPEVCHEQNQ